MALCLLVHLFVFRLLRLQRWQSSAMLVQLTERCEVSSSGVSKRPIISSSLVHVCLAVIACLMLRSCVCSLFAPDSFFFSSRRRHTRCSRDWSSDVCSSD